MEIILDAGKEIIHGLEEVARRDNKPLDVVALEMLSLGLRVHQASLEKSSGQDNEIDMYRNILKTTLINNEISSEILAIIFNKERSRLGAYDVDTALKMAKHNAEKYIQGGENL